jgi:hypothetical protein
MRRAHVLLLLLVLLGAALVPVDGAGADAGDRNGSVHATVRASPLDISLSLSSSSVQVGERLGAVSQVRNLGPDEIGEIELTLRTTPIGVGVLGRVSRSYSLSPRDARSDIWPLCALTEGGYVVMVSATVTAADGSSFTQDSNARLLTIRPGKESCPNAKKDD